MSGVSRGYCERGKTEWGVDAQFGGGCFKPELLKRGANWGSVNCFDPMTISGSLSEYAASKAHHPSDQFREMQSLHSKPACEGVTNVRFT